MSSSPTNRTYNLKQQLPTLKQEALDKAKASEGLCKHHKAAYKASLTANNPNQKAQKKYNEYKFAEGYDEFKANVTLQNYFNNKAYSNLAHEDATEEEAKTLIGEIHGDLVALMAQARLEARTQKHTRNSHAAYDIGDVSHAVQISLKGSSQQYQQKLLEELKSMAQQKAGLMQYQQKIQKLLDSWYDYPKQITLLTQETDKPLNSLRMQGLIDIVCDPLFKHIHSGDRQTHDRQTEAHLKFMLRENFKGLLWAHFGYQSGHQMNSSCVPIFSEILYLSATAIFKFLSHHDLSKYNQCEDIISAYQVFLRSKLNISIEEKLSSKPINLYVRSINSKNGICHFLRDLAAKPSAGFSYQHRSVNPVVTVTTEKCYNEDFAAFFFSSIHSQEQISRMVSQLPLLIEQSSILFNHVVCNYYESSKKVATERALQPSRRPGLSTRTSKLRTAPV